MGYASDSSLHAHHAIQVCVAADGPFRLRKGTSGEWASYDIGIIPSDFEHALDGGEARVALLYVDPETAEGRQLAIVYGELCRPALTADCIALLRSRIADDRAAEATLGDAASLRDAILGAMLPPTAPRRRIDARVALVLDRLRNTAAGAVCATDLAAGVSLSVGRFAHLFRDNTGVPVRRYLLWLRLVEALRLMASATSLTEVAHGAGFADSAHLTRTFRRMFGLAPSALHRSSSFVRIPDTKL